MQIRPLFGLHRPVPRDEIAIPRFVSTCKKASRVVSRTDSDQEAWRDKCQMIQNGI